MRHERHERRASGFWRRCQPTVLNLTKGHRSLHAVRGHNARTSREALARRPEGREEQMWPRRPQPRRQTDLPRPARGRFPAGSPVGIFRGRRCQVTPTVPSPPSKSSRRVPTAQQLEIALKEDKKSDRERSPRSQVRPSVEVATPGPPPAEAPAGPGRSSVPRCPAASADPRPRASEAG